jgi:hypothetical protein
MRADRASAPPAIITSASSKRDQPRGIANGMRPGGTRGDHRVVRPLEAMRIETCPEIRLISDRE